MYLYYPTTKQILLKTPSESEFFIFWPKSKRRKMKSSIMATILKR